MYTQTEIEEAKYWTTLIEDLRSQEAEEYFAKRSRIYGLVENARERGGYVRPVRIAYRHKKCGYLTIASPEVVHELALDPCSYESLSCTKCQHHFRKNQFVWADGSEVGL